jgi:hypothetical protein
MAQAPKGVIGLQSGGETPPARPGVGSFLLLTGRVAKVSTEACACVSGAGLPGHEVGTRVSSGLCDAEDAAGVARRAAGRGGRVRAAVRQGEPHPESQGAACSITAMARSALFQ